MFSNLIVSIRETMSGRPTFCFRDIRLRYIQGYSSGGDDLEDCTYSRTPRPSASIARAQTWCEVMENVLWIASATLFVYYGDCKSNFVFLLWWDDRINRTPLYFGVLCVLCNLGIFLYVKLFGMDTRRADHKWDAIPPSIVPVITLLGLVSFCLFSFALWPIWNFLTLPLLITLIMAFFVVLPYLPSIRRLKMQGNWSHI